MYRKAGKHLSLMAHRTVVQASHGVKWATTVLLAEQARPLRFIVTGGTAALLQLALLDMLIHVGLNDILANILAFIASAQLNFALSCLLTWHDRQQVAGVKHVFLSRWIAFHVSISGTFLLNQLVFIAARQFVPQLLASASGIIIAALVNFTVLNRLVFRERHTGRKKKGKKK